MVMIRNNKENKLYHLRTLEYLSQDILDENFMRIFVPYRIIQKILGSCRVDVRDRFVTAPTVFQKCYSVVFVALTIYSTVGLSQTYFAEGFVTDQAMKASFLSGVTVPCLMCMLTILHTRFLNNSSNVKFHVKMQKIDRVMGLNVIDSVYSLQYKLNLRAVLILITGFVALGLVTIGLTWGQFNVVYLFGPVFSMITYIIELACCCSHVTFFANRVRLINFVIRDHFVKENTKLTLSMQCLSFKTLRKIATEWKDFESSETDIYIEEIFSGFSSFQELYGFQVFIFCISFIFWVMLPFEYCILALQKNISLQILLLDFIHIFTLLYIKISLLISLCIHTELLLLEVKETKRLSVFVMSRYFDGPLRRKARNMLKLIQDTPICFSVYGMFQMNAGLLLSMFNIATSLLVTMLQLAYL